MARACHLKVKYPARQIHPFYRRPFIPIYALQPRSRCSFLFNMRSRFGWVAIGSGHKLIIIINNKIDDVAAVGIVPFGRRLMDFNFPFDLPATRSPHFCHTKVDR